MINLKACSKDGVVATTASSTTGFYSFSGLLPGCYYMVFSLPANFSATLTQVGTDDTIDSDIDATGTTAQYTLVAGQQLLTIAAGFRSSLEPASKRRTGMGTSFLAERALAQTQSKYT